MGAGSRRVTVIAARLYRNGERVCDIDLAQPLPRLEDPAELLWIGLLEPSPEELEPIETQLGLHPLAVEDALDPRHLPKIEPYGEHLFTVARTVHLDETESKSAITYGNTAVFMGQQFIVTVRHGSLRDHSPVRQQMEATPKLLARGADFVLHAILDFVVDGYLDVIDALEDRVLVMEDRALDAFLDREQTAQLFSLRRDLFRLQRVLGPMQDVASRCLHLELPQIDHDTQPYFRDLHDHVRRADYRVAGLRDTLTSVIETSGLLEQQRQGVITRQLAAWAAILAVPTAIAGIYGMNFKFMPELEWRYGYFLIVGVMATVCLTLYARFKWAKWL